MSEAAGPAPAGAPVPSPRTAGIGMLSALGAFLMWGLFPAYFKQLVEVPAVEVLAHRIVWSALFTAGLLTVIGNWRAVAIVFASRRLVATLALSAAVISLNWGVFIWAVANERVLESSLGYYINPLVSVMLGVIVLGERLRLMQWAAVALAAAAVGYEVLGLGRFPWVSLTLAFSFGFYGLIRKVVAADPLTGLFVETLLATPFALGYLLVLASRGEGHFSTEDWRVTGFLALAGVVTAMPLLLFVAAAKRIRLSTLGLLQYVVPTGHFLLAVLVYAEPLSNDRLVTFVCIWIALAVYSLDAARRDRGPSHRSPPKPPSSAPR